MEYCVYRFKDKEDNILYVGRTRNLDQRFKQHEHLTENVEKIEYIECINETDMIIKEIYYINLFFNKNSTNVKDVYGQPVNYGFNDEWKEYKKKKHERKEREKKERLAKTVFNTKNYMELSIIKLVLYCGDIETHAYVTHYDKDIERLKYSTYLYEAELFYNVEGRGM